MGLKATGCYLSRTLSYAGAEFSIARTDLDPVFEEMYDRASKFWQLLHTVCKNLTMGRQGWRMFWGERLLLQGSGQGCGSRIHAVGLSVGSDGLLPNQLTSGDQWALDFRTLGHRGLG